MKNIIFFIPNIERGGIEKNLVILSNFFLKKNYNIDIIYSQISQEIKKKLDKKVNLIKCKYNIKIPFLSFRVMNSINCFIFFLFKFDFKFKNIILSFQDHPLPILVSKIRNIPCILRIANHPYGSLKFFNNNLNFILKINVKKIFYYFATGIICNSKSSMNFFKKIYKKKKIVNIYNPIEIKKIRKSKKINNRIISVGRLENQKNFLGLVRAFDIVSKKLPGIQLLIVGSGREKKELQILCKLLNLSKKVVFKEYQNPDKLINSSKLFVLNSLWEGLPNILIETQILKTPILSTNCFSGPSEILINEKLGYLTPVNNHIKLANKIIFILKNYDKAQKKALIAPQNLKRFEKNSQCKKYELFLSRFY